MVMRFYIIPLQIAETLFFQARWSRLQGMVSYIIHLVIIPAHTARWDDHNMGAVDKSASSDLWQ